MQVLFVPLWIGSIWLPCKRGHRSIRSGHQLQMIILGGLRITLSRSFQKLLVHYFSFCISLHLLVICNSQHHHFSLLSSSFSVVVQESRRSLLSKGLYPLFSKKTFFKISGFTPSLKILSNRTQSTPLTWCDQHQESAVALWVFRNLLEISHHFLFNDFLYLSDFSVSLVTNWRNFVTIACLIFLMKT